MARLGMTIPLAGIALADHRDCLREMIDLGVRRREVDRRNRVAGAQPREDLAPAADRT